MTISVFFNVQDNKNYHECMLVLIWKFCSHNSRNKAIGSAILGEQGSRTEERCVISDLFLIKRYINILIANLGESLLTKHGTISLWSKEENNLILDSVSTKLWLVMVNEKSSNVPHQISPLRLLTRPQAFQFYKMKEYFEHCYTLELLTCKILGNLLMQNIANLCLLFSSSSTLRTFSRASPATWTFVTSSVPSLFNFRRRWKSNMEVKIGNQYWQEN